MSDAVKLNRADVMQRVTKIVNECTNDPADELIALGRAFTQIGEALQGRTASEARAIIRSAASLLDIDA